MISPQKSHAKLYPRYDLAYNFRSQIIHPSYILATMFLANSYLEYNLALLHRHNRFSENLYIKTKKLEHLFRQRPRSADICYVSGIIVRNLIFESKARTICCDHDSSNPDLYLFFNYNGWNNTELLLFQIIDVRQL